MLSVHADRWEGDSRGKTDRASYWTLFTARVSRPMVRAAVLRWSAPRDATRAIFAMASGSRRVASALSPVATAVRTFLIKVRMVVLWFRLVARRLMFWRARFSA